MGNLVDASALSAGSLFAGNSFVIPRYQRNYAWEEQEVRDFWEDLRSNVGSGSYFLGLIVLSGTGKTREVVDGQQRLLTLTLLANGVYAAALSAGRRALALKVRSMFLFSLDNETDVESPRMKLSDPRDDAALEALLQSQSPKENGDLEVHGRIADKLVWAAEYIRDELERDLGDDSRFKRLGEWVEFLENDIAFAMFEHDDPEEAYAVFEVVNARGRGLTNADLLKNLAIMSAPAEGRDEVYLRWTRLVRELEPAGAGAFVQFIRHVVTVRAAHVLPKDLYRKVAGRGSVGSREISHRGESYRTEKVQVLELLDDLEQWLPLYAQIAEIRDSGPAQDEWLPVFGAFRHLDVITVRPLLMALSKTEGAAEAMLDVLRLVVRRTVVGNLGTGNVERRFADAAFLVSRGVPWASVASSLSDLDPDAEDFERQAARRGFNRSFLAFLRRSQVSQSLTPERDGHLHLVRMRQHSDWDGFDDQEFSAWGTTLGNTLLAEVSRRPSGAASWEQVQMNLLPLAVEGEELNPEGARKEWTVADVRARGEVIARELARIWYR